MKDLYNRDNIEKALKDLCPFIKRINVEPAHLKPFHVTCTIELRFLFNLYLAINPAKKDNMIKALNDYMNNRIMTPYTIEIWAI